jgi:uncharacterized protein
MAGISEPGGKMMLMPDDSISPESTTRPSWLDLLLYLAGGFGMFAASGFLLRGITRQNTIAASSLVYALNVFFFCGSVVVFGFLRRKVSPAQLGIWPPKWRWIWLGYAALIVAMLYPLRIVLALIVQLLVSGNLTSLVDSSRMQIIVPAGNNGFNFAVTFVLVGLAAPFAEELYFRGALYTWFRSRFNHIWVGVTASSLLFALGHADSAAVAASSLVLGVVNALVFEQTRSIWATYAIHALNNCLAVALVYGMLLLNSGR